MNLGGSSTASATTTPSTSTTSTDSGSSAPLPEGNVTAHFKWSELACHNGDQVPQEMRADAKKLCENLEVIREAFGGKAITITSCYRSPDYNASIDGAPQSQHLYAKAADFNVSGVSPSTVRAKIVELGQQNKIHVGGLGYYDDFTHYDIRDSGGSFITW